MTDLSTKISLIRKNPFEVQPYSLPSMLLTNKPKLSSLLPILQTRIFVLLFTANVSIPARNLAGRYKVWIVSYFASTFKAHMLLFAAHRPKRSTQATSLCAERTLQLLFTPNSDGRLQSEWRNGCENGEQKQSVYIRQSASHENLQGK